MPFFSYPELAARPVDRPRLFLCVVDDTPESRVALRFAAGRAAHTLGGLVGLVYISPPPEFVNWIGVGDRMAEEAQEKAEARLAVLAAELMDLTPTPPETFIRRGKAAPEILALLKADPRVFALVLAASPGGEPGPLVDFFSGGVAGSLPCPVIIVPGGLSNAAVDAMV